MNNRIILVISVLFGVFMLIRNEITYRNHRIIGDAIYAYGMDCILNGTFLSREVCYDDVESYEKTIFRLWDFGYTRLLPPEKFEIIKPYIRY